jgi:hypothetical protein
VGGPSAARRYGKDLGMVNRPLVPRLSNLLLYHKWTTGLHLHACAS